MLYDKRTSQNCLQRWLTILDIPLQLVVFRFEYSGEHTGQVTLLQLLQDTRKEFILFYGDRHPL